MRTAFEEARRTGRPIVLDFRASWCAPCERLKKETFGDPAVAAALTKVVLVEIDLDGHPGLGKHYGVSAIRDVLFLDPQGRQVDRLNGLEPAGPFLERLTKLISARKGG